MLSSSFNWTNSISFSRGKGLLKKVKWITVNLVSTRERTTPYSAVYPAGYAEFLWIHSVSVEKSLFFLPSSVDSSYIQYTILRRSFISHQLSRINESQLQILWTASMLCTLYWLYSRLHVRLSCWAKVWLNATYKLEHLVLDRHWL